jgi:hypothetical protein
MTVQWLENGAGPSRSGWYRRRRLHGSIPQEENVPGRLPTTRSPKLRAAHPYWLYGASDVGTEPIRAFRVSPFEVHPFEAGPFRVPPSEGPGTPYAEDCDTIGSGWPEQGVGQFAPYARAFRTYGHPIPRRWPLPEAQRSAQSAVQHCPPGYKRDAYGGCSKATSRQAYVSWTAGLGQEEFRAGPVTSVEKKEEKTEYVKLAVVGVAGVILGALVF